MTCSTKESIKRKAKRQIIKWLMICTGLRKRSLVILTFPLRDRLCCRCTSELIHKTFMVTSCEDGGRASRAFSVFTLI